jgi:hypothetical protein
MGKIVISTNATLDGVVEDPEKPQPPSGAIPRAPTTWHLTRRWDTSGSSTRTDWGQ